MRKVEPMVCATCGRPCDGLHLVIIPTFVNGANRAVVGTRAFGSHACFMKYAAELRWAF